MKELADRWRISILEFNGEQDHVCLLVDMNPSILPSKFIKNLKTHKKTLICLFKSILFGNKCYVVKSLLPNFSWRCFSICFERIYRKSRSSAIMLLRCRLTSPPKLFELYVENYAYLLNTAQKRKSPSTCQGSGAFD